MSVGGNRSAARERSGAAESNAGHPEWSATGSCGLARFNVSPTRNDSALAYLSAISLLRPNRSGFSSAGLGNSHPSQNRSGAAAHVESDGQEASTVEDSPRELPAGRTIDWVLAAEMFEMTGASRSDTHGMRRFGALDRPAPPRVTDRMRKTRAT